MSERLNPGNSCVCLYRSDGTMATEFDTVEEFADNENLKPKDAWRFLIMAQREGVRILWGDDLVSVRIVRKT